MHILPLILSVWSYKQGLEQKIQDSQGRLQWYEHEAIPRLAVNAEGQMIVKSGDSTALTTLERDSVRYNRTFEPINRRAVQRTNEVQGSHFATTELCHVGTDAWANLKNRLGENGIQIDDEQVAVLSAGFFAERKLQEITGRKDPKRLRDELESDAVDLKGNPCFDARWVRELNSHPDREAIADECFADLSKNFPMAIGADVEQTNRAIAYDPSIIETETV